MPTPSVFTLMSTVVPFTCLGSDIFQATRFSLRVRVKALLLSALLPVFAFIGVELSELL
jgi:hypothetical protein